jgi:subtilisin family serine protease
MTDRLDAYIELSAGHMLAKTNGTLSQLLSADSSLRTINQSQGSSRVDVFQLLKSASFCVENGQEVASKVGERLAQACGLDPDAADFTTAKLRQAFVDRTNSVIDSSSYIAEQQQTHIELLERLRAKGTIVVTSAGNSADELWDLRARGLRVPDCFDDDLSKVGPKLIVGALDDHGTPDRSDDEIAFFTSLYSNVNVMANGVKVETVGGPATGTSYASPVVAGTAEKIRREHPDWTVDQIEAETKGRFTATDGFNLLP